MTTSRLVARVTGIALAGVGVAALVWAFGFVSSDDLPDPPPSYALESAIILRAEWALVATVAAAIPLVLIGRLLTGRFPDRISTRGAEWAPEVVDEIAELEATINDIVDILEDLSDQLGDHESRLGKIGA